MVRLTAFAAFLLASCGTQHGAYATSREKSILSQATQADFRIVVLGDSFVELADLPTLCGRRVLNAGVSGATAADVADLAPQLLGRRPDLVVIAVGLNDTNRNEMTSDVAFRASYDRIFASVRQSGAKIALIGVPIVRNEQFDIGRGEALRAIVRGYGALALPELPTTDGVHPNADGYVTWKSVLSRVCPTARQVG